MNLDGNYITTPDNSIDYSLPEGEVQLFSFDGMPDTVLAHIDAVPQEEWVYGMLTDWDCEEREGKEEYEGLDDDESLYYSGTARDDGEEARDPSKPWSVWWCTDYSMCFGEAEFATREEALDYLVEKTGCYYKDGTLRVD